MPGLPDSASSTGDVVEINFIDVRIDGLFNEEDVSSKGSAVSSRFNVMER